MNIKEMREAAAYRSAGKSRKKRGGRAAKAISKRRSRY